jgi:hypothetical protein
VERVIQARVIDSLFTVDTTRLVVVGDSTISGGTHFVDEDYQSALRMLGPLPNGLQADFEAMRGRRLPVDSLRTKFPMVQLSAAVRRDLAKERDPRRFWPGFFRMFPGSPGWIELSRVGFSRDGNSAVILVEYGCGALCGGTRYVLLNRKAGAWHIVRVAQPRIS